MAAVLAYRTKTFSSTPPVGQAMCWSAPLHSASIPDRHDTHVELADARAVSSGSGRYRWSTRRNLLSYIEAAVHDWRWSLEERFVHVCKELEGIVASAEALDDELHVPDAFFPLPL